ncbi:hypothetical protein UFOVP326_102 [uncultured Caudovirales phage]|uniref:RecT family n=1 Tax=uncultured Caudovirales phage TaxID=2100421 RepID=A0A6J5LTT2_9CAUD|nr:hypothetical protein UFOVP326_102 [uncultured Caudovirales phage]
MTNPDMLAASAPPARESPVQRTIPAAQPAPRRAPPRAGADGPPPEVAMPDITVGFGSLKGFELGQRMARMLCMMEVIPDRYRARYQKKNGEWVDNPAAVPNCFAALTMTESLRRSGVSVEVPTVMANLYMVHGQPAWSGQFVIALVNASTDRFAHPLEYEWTAGPGMKHVVYQDKEWPEGGGRPRIVERAIDVPDLSVIAWTTSRTTGRRVESPPISCELAVKEGWWQGNPKWQSMTQQMMVFRAGAWFGRAHCPERLMGLGMAEEYAPTVDGAIFADDEAPAAQQGQALTQEQHVTLDLDGQAEREHALVQTQDQDNNPPARTEADDDGFGGLA